MFHRITIVYNNNKQFWKLSCYGLYKEVLILVVLPFKNICFEGVKWKVIKEINGWKMYTKELKYMYIVV